MENVSIDVFTHPGHGGKVTCHKCVGFINRAEIPIEMSGVYFHGKCFNRYEHYYGLDKPID